MQRKGAHYDPLIHMLVFISFFKGDGEAEGVFLLVRGPSGDQFRLWGMRGRCVLRCGEVQSSFWVEVKR